MTKEAEPTRRRGRPRLSEEERKRHTMTFRRRDDLRAAVEELARANGRSMSEQIEYYVESSVGSEVRLIYEYSTDALSPTLFKAMTTREHTAQGTGLRVDFPAGHREMLTINGENHLNQPSTGAHLPWVHQPGGREGAVAMARAMLDATRKGAVDALTSALGVEIVQEALSAEVQDANDATERRIAATVNKLRAELEHLRLKAEPLPPRPSARNRAEIEEEKEPGFPLSALAARIGRMVGPSPDFRELTLSTWPRKFSDLPQSTQSGLTAMFRGEAPAVYETMMRPDLPRDMLGQPRIDPAEREAYHTERAIALVRMQRALLLDPDDGEAVEAGEGPSAGREGTA